MSYSANQITKGSQLFIPAPKKTHARSVAKALTWRIFGSIDTLAISFLLTGSFATAAALCGSETFTKFFLYFMHERMWEKIGFGVTKVPA